MTRRLGRIRPLAPGLALLLAGCCGGPQLQALRFDPRLELERRERFALLATALDHPKAWAFGEPAAAIDARADAYRPEANRACETLAVLPISAAPEPLRRGLERVRAALIERGYRPAEEGDEPAPAPGSAAPDFFVLVSFTLDGAGQPLRAGLHVGAEGDRGRFDPFRASFAAEASSDDGCPIVPDELIDALVLAVPRRDASRTR